MDGGLKSAEEILKSRIGVQVIAPAVNVSATQVLHKDKRTDEMRRLRFLKLMQSEKE